MVKSYHTNIQNVLSEICEEHPETFKRYFKGNKKIDINHPTKKNYSIIYFPDFAIQTKADNYIIFQILDSQAKSTALIIPNVVQAYLSEHVKKLFFIMKSNAEADKTKEISETLLAKIEDLSKAPMRNPLTVIYIIIPENSNNGRIKSSILEALDIIAKREIKEGEGDISTILSSTDFIKGSGKLTELQLISSTAIPANKLEGILTTPQPLLSSSTNIKPSTGLSLISSPSIGKLTPIVRKRKRYSKSNKPKSYAYFTNEGKVKRVKQERIK